MDKEYIVRSHLGNAVCICIPVVQICVSFSSSSSILFNTPLHTQLKPGDLALGYDMGRINFNSDDIDKYSPELIPSVVLVRKHYPNQSQRRRKRRWALKHLPKMQNPGVSKAAEEKDAKEMDEFLDELERDDEYRKNVGIYRDNARDLVSMTTFDDGEEARVGLEEMLDGLEEEPAPQELRGDEPEGEMC